MKKAKTTATQQNGTAPVPEKARIETAIQRLEARRRVLEPSQWELKPTVVDHTKLTPQELVEEMDRNCKKHRGGNRLEVFQYGQAGRTETLYINTADGHCYLEASGKVDWIYYLDSLNWFRKVRGQGWWMDSREGEGFDLWLSMLQGHMELGHNARAKELRAAKAKAKKSTPTKAAVKGGAR